MNMHKPVFALFNDFSPFKYIQSTSNPIYFFKFHIAIKHTNTHTHAHTHTVDVNMDPAHYV